MKKLTPVSEIMERFGGLLDSFRARVYQAQSRNEPGVDSAELKVINYLTQTLTQRDQELLDICREKYKIDISEIINNK